MLKIFELNKNFRAERKRVRYCAAGEAACWRSCTVTGLSEELAGRVELAEAIVFCWLASLVQVPLFVGDLWCTWRASATPPWRLQIILSR